MAKRYAGSNGERAADIKSAVAAKRAKIERLRSALEPLAKFADETRYARWRGLVPGSGVTVEEAERARDALAAM